MDETFWSAPEPFAKISMRMADSETRGQSIAGGFSLLPNRMSQTYEIVINQILEKLGGQPASLQTIINDFESVVFKSV